MYKVLGGLGEKGSKGQQHIVTISKRKGKKEKEKGKTKFFIYFEEYSWALLVKELISKTKCILIVVEEKTLEFLLC